MIRKQKVLDIIIEKKMHMPVLTYIGGAGRGVGGYGMLAYYNTTTDLPSLSFDIV